MVINILYSFCRTCPYMKLRFGYWITTVSIRWNCMFPCRRLQTNSHTYWIAYRFIFRWDRADFFYPTQWKVLSYVNLRTTQLLWNQVKAHQVQLVNYCLNIHNATWDSLIDCRALTPYTRSKVVFVAVLNAVQFVPFGCGTSGHQRSVYDTTENDVT